MSQEHVFIYNIYQSRNSLFSGDLSTACTNILLVNGDLGHTTSANNKSRLSPFLGLCTHTRGNMGKEWAFLFLQFFPLPIPLSIPSWAILRGSELNYFNKNRHSS
jgi:hypothetical protein